MDTRRCAGRPPPFSAVPSASYWIARPAKIDAAFDGFLLPLLGIIFLPFATLIYALLYTPGIGLTGWEWFWVVVAGLFDIVQWAAGASQRSQFPGRRSTV
jgi:hypothetical protein